SEPPPEETKPKMPMAFARSVGSVNSVIIIERGNRPADPLERTRRDKHPLRVGKAAHRRRSGEDSHTCEEHAPMTQQVPQPAPEQKEATKGDQVRVDNPRERRFRETKIRADRRERDPTIVTSRTIISSPRQRTSSASQRASCARAPPRPP